jgi:hypothetical protein
MALAASSTVIWAEAVTTGLVQIFASMMEPSFRLGQF